MVLAYVFTHSILAFHALNQSTVLMELRAVHQLGDMPCSWFLECTRSSKTTHGAAECILRTTPLQLHLRARPSKVRGSPEVDDRPFLYICSSRLGGPTTDCGTKPTSIAQVPNRAPS